MKPWMKILMWAGLGGGIGFFAGYQVGSRGRGRMITTAYEEGKTDGYFECTLQRDEYESVMNTYRGDDFEEDLDEDGMPNVSPSEDDDEEEEEDAEMPEEIPVIDELDEIPQMHPQYLVPQQISEEEYYQNANNDYQERLYFYELDEVLYNPETKEAIQNKDKMDQLIGIGMTFNFYKSDGEVLDAIFVKNETLGMIFRIDRIEAAYTDEIAGKNGAEYLEDDDTE